MGKDDKKTPAPGSFSKLMGQETKKGAGNQKDKRASTHARVHAEDNQKETNARTRALVESELEQVVRSKKHLSTFTFRFKQEELEWLDRVVEKINKEVGQKVSKNDVVRLGLNIVLKDYEENKDKSKLAQVFARL